MEPIDAVFDGIPVKVRALAHGTDPGTVVLAIDGPLGGGLELGRDRARDLYVQIGCANVRAGQLEADARAQAAVYAHA